MLCSSSMPTGPMAAIMSCLKISLHQALADVTDSLQHAMQMMPDATTQLMQHNRQGADDECGSHHP